MKVSNERLEDFLQRRVSCVTPDVLASIIGELLSYRAAAGEVIEEPADSPFAATRRMRERERERERLRRQ